MTSKIVYNGDLRTTSTHLSSHETIITDAPVDNNGKGAAFSPTDMVANSVATCALTIMGIYANNNNVDINNTEANVTKTMASNPRRISEVKVAFIMPPAISYSDKEKEALERAARACPVMQSIHPDIKVEMVFNWED